MSLFHPLHKALLFLYNSLHRHLNNSTGACKDVEANVGGSHSPYRVYSLAALSLLRHLTSSYPRGSKDDEANVGGPHFSRRLYS